MDIYRYDESFRRKGFHRIAGIDEAGRGPLAGPVVASAVVLPPGRRIRGLRDSKKVPEKERESLFFDVLCSCLDVGVGIVDAETIDRVNILESTRLAMQMAVKDLTFGADLLLIDAIVLPSAEIAQVSMIRGESRSASIAAASIIAKVVRDGIMRDYDSIYPEYGFAHHKGYSTKEHMERIILHGPCPIHRRSFEKVLSLPLPFMED
ncbi:MAG TPA: ribonuclease HII [Thermodesulfovibrionales bacterium]|nr:ribonuclease HII [Thermodesulfovibrionales bacterium]